MMTNVDETPTTRGTTIEAATKEDDRKRLVIFIQLKEWVKVVARLKTERGKKEASTKQTGWRNWKTFQYVIHFACQKRDPPFCVVRALLDAYPEGIKQLSHYGDLPIHSACGMCGSPSLSKCDICFSLGCPYSAKKDVIDLLIQSYPEGLQQVSDRRRRLPIHIAASNERLPAGVMNRLIQSYPEGVKKADLYGRLPIHYAVRRRKSPDVINILVQAYPQGLQQRDENGWLPIHYAIEQNVPIEVMQNLLDHYPMSILLTCRYEIGDCRRRGTPPKFHFFPSELAFWNKETSDEVQKQEMVSFLKSRETCYIFDLANTATTLSQNNPNKNNTKKCKKRKLVKLSNPVIPGRKKLERRFTDPSIMCNIFDVRSSAWIFIYKKGTYYPG